MAQVGGGRIAAYDGFIDDGVDGNLDSFSTGLHLDAAVVAGPGGGGGESVLTGDDPSGSIPDNLLLAHYCSMATPPRDATDEARQEADESWEPVREWLRTHQADEVKAATEQLGESNMTALHFACRNVPPRDVIDVFLSIAQDVVQWPDSFGWLPIHYACACGADVEVIRCLAEAFPDSKTTFDRRGRTPLHFALGSSTPERPVSPAVVVLLSSSGAASFADDNGMLPLHYACAYGASEDALYVLTDAYPEGITSVDSRNRIPLHFALSNAGRKASPATVRLLLSLNREIVNSVNGGPLPVRVLVEFAHSIRKRAGPEQKESVGRCLEYLIEARPTPTPDFFTALQMLPEWASDRAVVMPVLQEVLNEKISQRFPTAVIMLDFYFLAIILVTYHILVIKSIKLRGWPYNRFMEVNYDELNSLTDGNPQNVAVPGVQLIPLYMGASYFFLREAVQVVSLISLKSVHLWVYSPGNWVNIAFFVVLVFWASVMQRGLLSRDQFRTGVTFSASIIWMKLLVYLRNVLIEFAVFVGGVLYVLRSLAAFFVASFIVLIAFVQIFVTVHQRTSFCTRQSYQDISYISNLQCDNGSVHRWCSYWNAFLGVFSMIVKNLPSVVDAAPDGTDGPHQSSSPVITGGTVTGKVTFVIFYFVAVILLANILIGIVTATYKVIQQQRAAIVFWSNRLDFVAEMDIIAHGPWKSRLKRIMGFMGGDRVDANPSQFGGNTFGKEFWKRLMDLFEDEVEAGVSFSEYICYFLIRLVAALIIIPLWMALGILSAGWLWPPQVRGGLFTSSVKTQSTDAEKEDELRRTAVKMLETEVKQFDDDVAGELAMNRTQVVQMKSQVADRRQEIASEMKHVKRLITMLFEHQAPADV